MGLAFPLRMQENGLLRRQDPNAAIMSLLHVMARTPAGSWQGSKAFGLRDLFENSRLRADTARLAMARINEVFRDLGIEQYLVTEVVREISPGRDIDTYAITIEQTGGREGFTTLVSSEQ